MNIFLRASYMMNVMWYLVTDFCPCNCKPADIFYVLTFCVTFGTLKFDFCVIFETADLTIYIFHFSFHFRADEDVQRNIESFS